MTGAAAPAAATRPHGPAELNESGSVVSPSSVTVPVTLAASELPRLPRHAAGPFTVPASVPRHDHGRILGPATAAAARRLGPWPSRLPGRFSFGR